MYSNTDDYFAMRQLYANTAMAAHTNHTIHVNEQN